MKLMINVGGRGKRMGTLTEDIPKPMVLLNGKPILEYLVKWAKDNSFSDIILLCGYKSEVIQEYFGSGEKFGINIFYSIESEPLGSGGPIKNARKFVDDTFAYINGDLYCEVDFAGMAEAHFKSNVVMTVLVHESSHPQDSDVLLVDNDDKVIRFVSKHDDHTGCGNLTNAGLCIIEPRVFDYMEENVFTFETYVYPRLLAEGECMHAYVTEEMIKDIGTVDRLCEVEKRLRGI